MSSYVINPGYWSRNGVTDRFLHLAQLPVLEFLQCKVVIKRGRLGKNVTATFA